MKYKYRLINKNIGDLVDDDDFCLHRMIFSSNNARDVVNFVEKRPKLKTSDLSVITSMPNQCITIFSLTSMKWIR